MKKLYTGCEAYEAISIGILQIFIEKTNGARRVMRKTKKIERQKTTLKIYNPVVKA